MTSSTNETPGRDLGTGRERKLKLARRRKKKQYNTNEHLAAISKKLLKTRLNVGTFAEVLNELQRKRIGQLFVRKSRENYLEAIKLALALYYSVQNEPDPIATLQPLVTETEYRVTKRTNAAQIVVRMVIDYGKTDAERRANRQYASRDAAAVNHLAKRGVLPDQVVELGKRRAKDWRLGDAPALGCQPQRNVLTVPPPKRPGINARPEIGLAKLARLQSRMTRRKSWTTLVAEAR
jgi:hypothetical protein